MAASYRLADAGGEVPPLFSRTPFNSATLAEAANHYISLGEKRTIEELKALEQDPSAGMDRGFQTNARIGWICRIVFERRRDQPLRPPRFGALNLPSLTMPPERWPRYPVAGSDGVFFVLSEGYLLAGVAERASEYIDYCSANGSFRKTKVKVPTRAEALAAFDALTTSASWKAIKWKDEKPGIKYAPGEKWISTNVRAQAISIPAN